MKKNGDGHIYRDTFYFADEEMTKESLADGIRTSLIVFLERVENISKCQIGHEEIKFDSVNIKTFRNEENGHLDLMFQVETKSVPATCSELLTAVINERLTR